MAKNDFVLCVLFELLLQKKSAQIFDVYSTAI